MPSTSQDWVGGASGVIGSLISGLFSSSSTKKQNKFEAEQAQINREYQTAEREASQDYNTSEREASQVYNTAEREAAQSYNTSERVASQDWQEDFYNKYSSPQAMVQQYQDAGLNPALMFGQAGASTGDVPASDPASVSPQSSQPGSSSAGSGSMARAVQGLSALDFISTAVESFDKIVSSLGNIRKNKAQSIANKWLDVEHGKAIEETESRISLNNANAFLSSMKSKTEEQRADFLNAKTKETVQNILNLESVNEKLKAEVKNLGYDTLEKMAKASYNFFVDIDYLDKSTMAELRQMQVVTERAQQLLIEGKTKQAYAEIASLDANTAYRKYCNSVLFQTSYYEPGMTLFQAVPSVVFAASKQVGSFMDMLTNTVTAKVKNFFSDTKSNWNSHSKGSSIPNMINSYDTLYGR